MLLRRSGGEKRKLNVLAMALALAIAAFLGGALGLVWQNSSFFDDAEEEEEIVITAPDTD